MAIYLQYDGIKGNATAEGYKDHISIISAKLSIDQNISMETGNTANRMSSRPRLSELLLVKIADGSTPSLFTESLASNIAKKAEIKFVHIDGNKMQMYMSIALENCLVSEYTTNGGANSPPVERIKLSYTKIQINYRNFDSANQLSGTLRVGYDLETGNALSL